MLTGGKGKEEGLGRRWGDGGRRRGGGGITRGGQNGKDTSFSELLRMCCGWLSGEKEV